MKILFNTYPMAFHTPGGGEMQLLNYQRYLEKHKVQVSLFNLWNPQFFNYDIVHFFSVMSGSIPFCDFVKQLKLPLVVTSSLWVTEETKHLYPSDEIRVQLSLADRVITNSQVESVQLATVYQLPKEKFSVVYNGVDPIFFENVSAELFRKHYQIDYPFVLNVANVEPRKNQINLLHALKLFPQLKLVTIGHARVPSYLEQCAELGSDQFVFLGSIDHYDPLLRSAYAACEFFALPSTLETPGLAALEAAAQGAKLLVTGVGAAREYFGSEAIYVDQPHDVTEIQNQIQSVLSLAKSDRLARYVQSNFSWDRVIRALVDVYHHSCQRTS